MRIVSDFHDYYDTAMGLGQDPKLVWNRRTVELAEGPGGAVYTMGEEWWFHTRRLSQGRVTWAVWNLLFCGSSYPLTVLGRRTGFSGEYKPTYCWSSADVDEFIGKQKKKIREAYGKRPAYRWRGRRHEPFTPEGVHRIFTETQPDPKVIEQLHRKHHKPVLLIRPKSDRSSRQVTVVDPVLFDIGFQRVMDPFTCFQEIAGYLGGVLGIPEMEHDPISDEDMRDMKGFDEWSFKQQSPGDRKRRRRGRRK
jgi:hypothetical protein